jgi:hypothetical protein
MISRDRTAIVSQIRELSNALNRLKTMVSNSNSRLRIGASENFVIGRGAVCGPESTASRSLWHGKHRKSVRGLVSARYSAHSAVQAAVSAIAARLNRRKKSSNRKQP